MLRNDSTGFLFKDLDDILGVCFKPTMARQLEESLGEVVADDIMNRYSSAIKVNTRDVVGEYFFAFGHIDIVFVSEKEVYFMTYARVCEKAVEENDILKTKRHVYENGIDFLKESERAMEELDNIEPCGNIAECEEGHFVFLFEESTGAFLGVYTVVPSFLFKNVLNPNVVYRCDSCGTQVVTDQTAKCMNFFAKTKRRICDECVKRTGNIRISNKREE